jgi:hypothetical protein
MNRAPSPRHLLLRTALRQGDPGAGAALAPEEEEAMRRATLAAAAAHRHRPAGRLATHPGTTRWSTLRPLGMAAAAAAAICVAVAVSWVSWQGRPWPRRAAEAGPRWAAEAAPRPQDQRPALAAHRPLPPALGSTALLDRRVPRRTGTTAPARVAADDEPGEIAHAGDATGGTGVADTAGVLDTAAVADLGPQPGAEAAIEAATETAGAPDPLARDTSAEAGPSAPPRQVQFSIPGGTRVIWLMQAPNPR